ncbi:D-alanyl-D-alanine carboxypeptidase [Rhodovulum adriaticum]|nr:D-alanyl-D-alanine carboxypeptidase [Rhodovulum adriaticum]
MHRPGRYARIVLFLCALTVGLTVGGVSVRAAPYAAMVVDARTGEVLHARNADTRLHPASLTKMMTLYIAFQAVEHGEIGLDDMITISRNAAAEPPSKLGLRTGQKIKLRYLIRAAAVRSANDAATAIGEAISGSEEAFAARMTRTARAMGMTRTTFKNANGLTAEGHLSTARDMTTLGRHILYDYPEYYNLFSRISTHAGIKTVNNTNRRLLSSYQGADGIKTGYTSAAGFNLVASAQRGGKRVIATVFGGRSTVTRNAKVAELLDLGFKRAPASVAMRRPPLPDYRSVASGRTVTADLVLRRSMRPVPRPGAAPAPELIATLTESVATTVEQAQAELAASAAAQRPGVLPLARPDTLAAATPAPAPMPLPAAEPEAGPVREIVTRMSSSGGRHWGIEVGRYPSRYKAERVLLQTALREIDTLDEALRKVVRDPRGYQAQFVGMSQQEAARACRRLEARGTTCTPIGPSS